MTFIDTVLTYARAGYPAVAIISHEEARVLGDLDAAAKEAGRALAVWSVTQGWLGLGGGQAAGDPPGAVKAVLEFGEPCFAVLKDFHWYLEAPETSAAVIRTIRDTLPVLQGEQKTLVFLSPRLALPMELQKDVALVDFPLPDPDALGALLDRLVRDAETDWNQPVPVTQRDDLLDAACGLTWNEAENAMSLALQRHGRIDAEAVATVQAEKTALVRKTGLLEVWTPAESVAHIGGLGPLKAWLELQGQVFRNAARALAYGFTPKDLPRGLGLVGVPGSGKSLTAQAVAASWTLPLLRLDMSRILGSLMGQSEQQMRQALELAEAMAPAVLWADELEKSLAGSESSGLTDGGVLARAVGSFLTWRQESTAPVYVIATVNRVAGAPARAPPGRAVRRLVLLRPPRAGRPPGGAPDPPRQTQAGSERLRAGPGAAQARRLHPRRGRAGRQDRIDPRLRGRAAADDDRRPSRRRPRRHAHLGDPGRRDYCASGLGQAPGAGGERAAGLERGPAPHHAPHPHEVTYGPDLS